MAETFSGDKTKGITLSWAKALDEWLTWVQPAHSAGSHSRLPWWPGMEQKLADLHARYERACIED